MWFRFLVPSGTIEGNPALHLELPRSTRPLPKPVFSAAEVERVLAQPDLSTVTGIRYRAIIETLFANGIRRQKLARLSLDDLDRVTKTLSGDPDELRGVGVRCEGPHQGLVTVSGVEVTVDLLDHPQRAVPSDLGEQERVHPGPQGIGDEAVTQEVRVDPLRVEASPLGGVIDELEEPAPGELFVLTRPATTQGEEHLGVSGFTRAGVPDISLDPPKQCGCEGHEAFSIALAFDSEEGLAVMPDDVRHPEAAQLGRSKATVSEDTNNDPVTFRRRGALQGVQLLPAQHVQDAPRQPGKGRPGGHRFAFLGTPRQEPANGSGVGVNAVLRQWSAVLAPALQKIDRERVHGASVELSRLADPTLLTPRHEDRPQWISVTRRDGRRSESACLARHEVILDELMQRRKGRWRGHD